MSEIPLVGGRTPLHLAAIRGHVGIIRLLLDAGAPINDRDVEGNTALELATRHGNTDAAKLLIERGGTI